MDAESLHQNNENEEEYVLLDLDDVSEHLNITPNAPYILAGLDTLNPVLTIGDNLKLVGEYQETIGTCIVFTENESEPLVHEETGLSERNQVKPIAGVQKIWKFRLSLDVGIPNVVAEPSTNPLDRART